MAKVDVDTLEIRLMRPEDLSAIVKIDERYSGHSREEYYREKVARHLDTSHQLALSLVATQEGRIAGFLMGEVSRGSYGLPEGVAAVDTIGVDPAFRGSGVAHVLMDEFTAHVRRLGVEKVYTLVHWEDEGLLHYFRRTGFRPGAVLYLEKEI